jgi:hypothetical protein
VAEPKKTTEKTKKKPLKLSRDIWIITAVSGQQKN